MSSLKRKPAFGKMNPIKPDPEAEGAFLDQAAGKDWSDRNLPEEGQGGEEQISKAESEAVVGSDDTSATTRVRKATAAAKKPARPAPVSEAFPDLVEQYISSMIAGEALPLPPNPMFQKVDRHRVYTMCPVHTAAALDAYAKANNYLQTWMAIDDLLRKANVYGPEGKDRR